MASPKGFDKEYIFNLIMPSASEPETEAEETEPEPSPQPKAEPEPEEAPDSLSLLREQLNRRNLFFLNYRTVCKGEIRYFQMKAVRTGFWKDVRTVVLGLRNVDEETRREMETIIRKNNSQLPRSPMKEAMRRAEEEKEGREGEGSDR